MVLPIHSGGKGEKRKEKDLFIQISYSIQQKHTPHLQLLNYNIDHLLALLYNDVTNQ